MPTGAAWVLYANYIDRRGTGLFHAVCENDMEGIVAKRKDGLYNPAETTWVKIQNRGQGEGRRELFEKRRGAAA
jgi:ATP-dependent DNA ligase